MSESQILMEMQMKDFEEFEQLRAMSSEEITHVVNKRIRHKNEAIRLRKENMKKAAP